MEPTEDMHKDTANDAQDVVMADAAPGKKLRPMQDISSLPYDLQEKIAKQNAVFKAKCDEKEIPLSVEEENTNMSGMEKLELGDAKNYKTRII